MIIERLAPRTERRYCSVQGSKKKNSEGFHTLCLGEIAELTQNDGKNTQNMKHEECQKIFE